MGLSLCLKCRRVACRSDGLCALISWKLGLEGSHRDLVTGRVLRGLLQLGTTVAFFMGQLEGCSGEAAGSGSL